MRMINVESSNIKAIGFEENVIYADGYSPHNVLRVEYLSGLIYDYLNVSKETYEALMKEESKGSYIHRKIKDKYCAIKIADANKTNTSN